MEETIFPGRLEDILVAALCVWRITHLLHAEDGPYDFLAKLRRRAGAGLFGQALACFYCLSLWLALPAALFIGAFWAQRLLLWPALSGAACLLERATTRPDFSGAIYEEKEF